MPTLIKGRRIVDASLALLKGEIVRLEPGDDPAAVAARLPHAAWVEVNFPKFGDGRGYSLGRLLRTRYGYRGELRAVGQVARDNLHFLERCGFDAFLVRDGEDPHEALRGFEDFTAAYQ